MPRSDYFSHLRVLVGLRPLVLAGVVVLIRDSCRRLLLQQGSDYGLSSPPGGRLEPGEREEEAAGREIKEDTGLRLQGLKLVAIASNKPMF